MSKLFKDVFIHESSYVDDNVAIGRGSKVWHFSHILDNCQIGEDCSFGQNVVIGPSVVIGNRVKIQNNVSVYEGVTLEDGVFLWSVMCFHQC
jgi:UDP-2-acetamido-3-amino-2,3-dideoxy-glucuronate N-acetyltransferase